MDAKLREEFIVKRNGKEFVLYAGLLDFAHEKGLKSIRTEIHQVPSKDNDFFAVATAIVVMEDNKTFHGIGDASKQSCAPAMHTCLLRMAETRAKSRALRDATNIGVAALEELGDTDESDSAATTAQRAETQEDKSLNALKNEFASLCEIMGHTWEGTEQGREDRRNFVSVLIGRKVSGLSVLNAEDWQKAIAALKAGAKQRKTA